MKLEHEKVVNIFKAFTDVNRLAILEMLRNGEMCSCKLEEGLPIKQSTLSHHMKILCDSGVVNGRKEGKWTHYSISDLGKQLAFDQLEYFTKGDNKILKCDCDKKED